MTPTERARQIARVVRETNRARLLDAPCVFCDYSGAGYWQSGTHASNCPWHTRGGFELREGLVCKFIAAALEEASAREAIVTHVTCRIHGCQQLEHRRLGITGDDPARQCTALAPDTGARCDKPEGHEAHTAPNGEAWSPCVATREAPAREAAATGTVCINCGERNRGGYQTEDVGPFCSDCWDRACLQFGSMARMPFRG